ncbi:MAG: hypothetical protein AAF543_16660 [Pseudomonadota bacterium]
MSWIVHCKERTAPVIPADGVFTAVAIYHPIGLFNVAGTFGIYVTDLPSATVGRPVSTSFFIGGSPRLFASSFANAKRARLFPQSNGKF